MHPNQPTTYPHRILLMVTGRSPQVITETIYSLCKEQNPPFIPTEVRIITTSKGAQDAQSSLLSDDPGWFKRLCLDWELPNIKFGTEQIQILSDANGKPLSDICTSTDNDQTADYIVETVRQLTEDDTSALHVSLAGGRKTMGYFLGYALSLYGRPQDRLSHVLVSSPFESNRDFFYPTPYSRVIHTPHMTPSEHDAKDGKILLADIPFVRLRDILPRPLKGLQTGVKSFSDIVHAAQQALTPPSITIDYRIAHGGVRIADGTFVKLPPADLAFYGWLARRCQRLDNPVTIPPKHAKEDSEFLLYLKEYQQEMKLADVPEHVGTELRAAKAMTFNFFHQRKTSLKECLEKALGPLAINYEIRQLVASRPGRFGLAIEPERIKFITD